MTEKQRIEKIISDLGNAVTGPTDFFGNAKPSLLFWPMVKLMRPLLSCDPDKMISKASIRVRKFLHPILLMLHVQKLPGSFRVFGAVVHAGQDVGVQVGHRLPRPWP